MLGGLYEEAVQVGALQWCALMLLCQYFKIQHSTGNNLVFLLLLLLFFINLSCIQVALFGLLFLCFC